MDICCLECIETKHDHSIKFIPKINYVLEKLFVQINEKDDNTM